MPLQVCKGQTHRDQLYFRAGLNTGTMRQAHGQKGMGAGLVFYFLSKETNHLAWKLFPGFVRRAIPLCWLPDCSFPINVPFLKENHPTALPALDFHMWGISRFVFEI